MRAFIILGFLAAVSNAGRLGYQYGPGVSGIRQETTLIGSGSSGSGALIGGGSSYGGSSGGLLGSSGSGFSGAGSSLSSSSIGQGIGSGLGGASYGGSYGGSPYGGASYFLNANALNSIPQTVQYNKQFFHYVAPAEHYDQGKIQRQLSNVLKKNLQVVFIKAPENNAATNAALQLAKQAIEKKTAIYVLSKENDSSQLIAQIRQIQDSVPTEPEVKFIKYRTAADISRAKQAIQQQYEATGGSTQNFYGGIAPVLNYASAGSPQLIGFGSSYGSGSGAQLVGGSSYGSGSGAQLVGGSSYGSGSGAQLVAASSHGSGSAAQIIGGSQLSGGANVGSSLGSSQLVSGSSLESGSSSGLESSSSGLESSSSGLESSSSSSGSSISDYLPPVVSKK